MNLSRLGLLSSSGTFRLMNEYPSFSVVIPTYNRAGFIEATLKSVLAQTYPALEVIIVDNCSTDDTDQVLDPYVRAGQIHLIKHDQNYERARSRNTGMRAARGDFVTLLDSDDFMYPTNLADAAEYARAHPDIKCFHNLFESVDSSGKMLYRYPMPDLKDQLKAIAHGNFMSCIGNFIHRDIYQHYAFDTNPDLTGGEDWEYWLRVLADFKLGRIDKINSGVQQHPGRSVNNQNLENMKRGLDHLCRKVATDPHLSHVYGQYLKQIRANSHLYLAILANTGGMFAEAQRFLLRAIRADSRLFASPRFWRISRRAVFRLRSA
jgi:glycosyltransferase involved in cell wall biosynthesis